MGRRKEPGFTLIELMTALAVAGILASIAYPSYVESVRKAGRTEGRAALMQLMQQEERFYSQNTRYIVFSSSSTNADEMKFKWFSGDSAGGSAYEIAASACADESIRDCVLLTARPGTAKVNVSFADIDCGDLMLTSTGVKSTSGTAVNCW